jgi:hypothetical protein
MTVTSERAAPEWFGSAARGTAFFPMLMSVYMLVYSVWFAVAWNAPGAILFAAIVVGAIVLGVRGVRQIRHASKFPAVPSDESRRIARSMGILNGVTHPIHIAGTLILLTLGELRWVLPLITLVIGAHFLPIAKILGRKIDYVVAPIMIAFAVVGGFLAANPDVSWTQVFAVTGIGGTIATGTYAVYLAHAYARLAKSAGVDFP